MNTYTSKQINEKSERLMDYYKDGEYSYDTFREDFPGEAIPGKYRAQKVLMKKTLEELNEKVKTDPGVECLLEYVFHDDEENIKKRQNVIKNLKNEIRVQKERIVQLERSNDIEDSQMERAYKREIMKEEHITEQGKELQRHRDREKKRYFVERRKQDEIQRIREIHRDEKAQLHHEIAELTLIAQEKKNNKQSNGNCSGKTNDKYKKKYLKLQIKYDDLLKKNESSDEGTTSDEEN
tara:strand:+ start:103 stop:813 length:711 start_codon:yes stop_codon:yes gene_type:complete